MSYVHFTRDIELQYHITIKGWTAEHFCNPSDLSNNVDELTKLRDALKSGDCKFVRLTDEQHAEIKKRYDADVEAGIAPQRKKRKDAGEKRKDSAKRRKQGTSEGDAEGSGSASARVENFEQLDPVLGMPSGSGE